MADVHPGGCFKKKLLSYRYKDFHHKDKTSMGECKKDVTPLLTHWSYVFLALTYRSYIYNGNHVPGKTSLYIETEPRSPTNGATLPQQTRHQAKLWPTSRWKFHWQSKFDGINFFKYDNSVIKSCTNDNGSAVKTIRHMWNLVDRGWPISNVLSSLNLYCTWKIK